MGWSGTSDNSVFIQVTTPNTFFSSGEKVTIIIAGDNKLLFNSRPSAYNNTINRNKMNLKKFLINMNQ